MRGRAARQQDARSGAASEYVAIPRGPVAIITAYWQAHRSAAEVAPGAGSGPGSAQVAQGVTRRVDSWPLILGAVIVLVGLASILA